MHDSAPTFVRSATFGQPGVAHFRAALIAIDFMSNPILRKSPPASAEFPAKIRACDHHIFSKAYCDETCNLGDGAFSKTFQLS